MDRQPFSSECLIPRPFFFIRECDVSLPQDLVFLYTKKMARNQISISALGELSMVFLVIAYFFSPQDLIGGKFGPVTAPP
jgi:hypothetical protein